MGKGENFLERLYNTIQRTIQFLEKERANLITAPLIVLAILLARIYVESVLFYSTDGITPFHLYHLLHNVFGLFGMFLGGLLVLAFFSQEKVMKVWNIMLCGFWIEIIPPIIDYYIFGRTEAYDYTLIITEMFGEKAGYGLIIPLLVIGILGMSYIWIKTESVKHVIYSIFALLTVMILGGSAALIPFTMLPFDYATRHVSLAILLFLSDVVIVGILLYISNKEIFRGLLKNLRVWWTIYFTIIGIVGMATMGQILFIYPNMPIMYGNDIPYAVLLIITIVFCSQYAFMMGDIYGGEKDKTINKKNPLTSGILTKKLYIQIAVLMAMISFAFSLTLAFLSTILILAFIGLVTLYNILSLKTRSRFYIPLVVGIESVLIFFTGYFASKHIHIYEFGNYIIGYPTPMSYDVSISAITVGIIIFIIGSAIPLILSKVRGEGG